MRKRIIAMLTIIGLLFGTDSRGIPAADVSAAATEQEIVQSAELEETAEALGDDDFAAASGISIGSTINGSITETARTRLYRFSLASSGRVTLDMTSYMQYYCIFIYGSDGTEIWNTCGNEWNSNLKYRRDTHEIDLTNGTYYMKITGYYNENEYTSSTGTYALGTKFVSASESCAEPNDDFGKASAIGTTGTVRGQIAENDRYDIYRFSLARAGRITLTMTSYMKYYTAHVYSSDGEEIWYTDWNEWNENLKYCMDTYDLDLAAGNYYLKVTGYRNSDYSASTGNYTMSLKYTDAQVNYREPNNDFSTAYALRTDTTVKGQIALNDRYDVLKFSLPASKDIKISMTSYMKYYMLVLYNSAGTEIWKTYDNEWNENVGYRKDTHTLTLSAGSYYLKVSGYKYYWDADYYASTGTYSLSVNTKASVADAVINAISSRTYTGKAIKPSVTVTYNGKKLQKGRDYTVAYKNNTAIGKATVIITGKGSYTGTKKLTFKIVPRKVKLISAKNSGKRAATIKWKRDNSVSGYVVYASLYETGGYKKQKTINRKQTVSIKKTGLKKGNTYYFKVRAYKNVNGKKIYGSFSNIRKVKITK